MGLVSYNMPHYIHINGKIAGVMGKHNVFSKMASQGTPFSVRDQFPYKKKHMEKKICVSVPKSSVYLVAYFRHGLVVSVIRSDEDVINLEIRAKGGAFTSCEDTVFYNGKKCNVYRLSPPERFNGMTAEQKQFMICCDLWGAYAEDMRSLFRREYLFDVPNAVREIGVVGLADFLEEIIKKHFEAIGLPYAVWRDAWKLVNNAVDAAALEVVRAHERMLPLWAEFHAALIRYADEHGL